MITLLAAISGICARAGIDDADSFLKWVVDVPSAAHVSTVNRYVAAGDPSVAIGPDGQVAFLIEGRVSVSGHKGGFYCGDGFEGSQLHFSTSSRELMISNAEAGAIVLKLPGLKVKSHHPDADLAWFNGGRQFIVHRRGTDSGAQEIRPPHALNLPRSTTLTAKALTEEVYLLKHWIRGRFPLRLQVADYRAQAWQRSAMVSIEAENFPQDGDAVHVFGNAYLVTLASSLAEAENFRRLMLYRDGQWWKAMSDYYVCTDIAVFGQCAVGFAKTVDDQADVPIVQHYAFLIEHNRTHRRKVAYTPLAVAINARRTKLAVLFSRGNEIYLATRSIPATLKE